MRRWAEKAAPACPRTQANKQNSNAVYATYSGRTVGRGEKPGGAEERHKRRPRPRRRTLHGAATVGRASWAVQPVRQGAWALARCCVRAGGRVGLFGEGMGGDERTGGRGGDQKLFIHFGSLGDQLQSRKTGRHTTAASTASLSNGQPTSAPGPAHGPHLRRTGGCDPYGGTRPAPLTTYKCCLHQAAAAPSTRPRW